MEQTVLLNFEIDQSKAIRDYERLEKVIMDNKAAQQELTQAYKAGNITQEEYIADQARLSQNLSKETQQRNTLKKVIEAETGSLNAERAALSSLIQQRNSLNKTTDEGLKKFNALNDQIRQLTESLKKSEQAGGNFGRNVGNYSNSIKDAAGQINIAGVNLGGLTSQLASFASPATAAIGVVAALGAAYAKSTLGAKDLEFAQKQLSIATTLLTNEFAKLITSAEDGEGAITTVVNGFLKFVDKIPIVALYSRLIGVNLSEIADKSKEIALAQEKIEDLGRDELAIREEASVRIENNQELLQKISDDQLSINERLSAADEIERNLVTNKAFIVEIQKQELAQLEKMLSGDRENEELQTKVAKKKAEITKESAAIERQITKINKVQDDLNAKLDAEAALRRQIARDKNAPVTDLKASNPGASALVNEAQGSFGAKDPVIQASDDRIEQYIKELKAVEFTEAQKQEYYRRGAAAKKEIDDISNEVYYASLSSVLGSVAGLFEEQTAGYKILASADALIATYSAATKSYDALASIPYVGPALGAAAAAAAIVSGLANVAQINGVQFAEGGYTGDGFKYQPAGVVHKGEVVWNQRDVAAVGGPSAADRMRPSYSGSVSRGTYANGGIVTAPITRQADQQMLMVNAMKNLPTPEVSVKEITRAQDRVRARERTSKLAS